MKTLQRVILSEAPATPARSRRTSAACSTLLTLLFACSNSPKDAAPIAAAVRDSSGVRIVEHPSDWQAKVPQFALADEPTTEFRDSVTAYSLIGRTPVILLEDGRVVFFAEQSVVIYGDNGRESERIGRPGEGPGEFRVGVLARGLGDTILVQDNAMRRVSFVVPGRGVVRSRTLRTATAVNGFELIGQSGSDALLLRTSGFRMPPGAHELPWFAARADSGVDGITIVDTLQAPVIVPGERGPTTRGLDFPPLVAAWGPELLTVGSRLSVVEVRRADGQLLRSIRLPMQVRLTDPATLARNIDSGVQFMRDNWPRLTHAGSPEPDWAAMRKEREARVVSDTIGPFQDVLIGDDGTAWLQKGGYKYTDSTYDWTGVARDGRIVGRLTGRRRDRIAAFGANSVLTMAEDADGIMVFRVYRLVTAKRP